MLAIDREKEAQNWSFPHPNNKTMLDMMPHLLKGVLKRLTHNLNTRVM